MAGKLEFQIHRVTCVKETSSGSIIGTHGSDNMILGAATIAPSGRATQIPTLSLGSFEGAGHHHTWHPPENPKHKLVASIPLSGGTPRAYGMLLVLAEQDLGGGTDEFVKQLVEDANASISPDDHADGGASVVAGEVAKAVGKKLVKLAEDRLREDLKDDIFHPQSVTKEVGSDSRFSNGKTSTVPEKLTFSGHGGVYTVEYLWAIAN